MSETAIEGVRFDDEGLVSAVIQDADGGAVLMVGYVNRESLEKTLDTGEVHFWSRSRGRLWRKGETSGNVLRVREIAIDCDSDCLLIRAEPSGPVCHTGARSCFFRTLPGGTPPAPLLGDRLGQLARTIDGRARERPPGSYTVELLDRGAGRIAQKVGEEAIEVVIAGATSSRDRLVEESADLLYHLVVLWQIAGVPPEEVARVLESRQGARRKEEA